MSDYNNSKPNLGSVFPPGAIEAQETHRLEPLITPEQLRRRQLALISLVSFFPDPITGKRYVVTDDDLKDAIIRAVSESEMETGLSIFPVQYSEKHPIDQEFWRQWGFVKVKQRPVASVEKFAFTPSTGYDIFEVNKDWLEAANFAKGQINLIPLVPALGTQFIPGSGNGSPGSAYLTLVSQMSWIPAFLLINYTTGFRDGLVPVVINEIIGINAAIDILSALAATYRVQSYSLGADALSQSVSGPGPMIYDGRIKFLMDKKDKLVKKIKNMYGLGVFVGQI